MESCFFLKRFSWRLGVLAVNLLFFSFVSNLFAESFQLKLGRMFAKGKAAEAAETIQGQLSNHPDQTRLWLELADLDINQGDYPGAVAALQAYLSKKNDWQVQKDLALIQEQMGDFKNAGVELHDLDRQHPHDPDILWGLARLCLYQSKWKDVRTQASSRDALKDAQKYLKDLLSLKPNFVLATWHLAEVSRELGDWGEALKAYEKAAWDDPNYKYAHRHIAWILAKQRRYREALAKYEQAMAVEPGDLALKKEAQDVALLAPQEEKKLKTERLQQWTRWTPPEEKAIAPSPVTLRVGIASNLQELLFRGVSDLEVFERPPALSSPAQSPPTPAFLGIDPISLKAGEDYRLLYQAPRPGSKAKTTWKIKDSKGKTVLTFDKALWIRPKDSLQPLVLHAIPSNPGYFSAKEEDRAYRGFLEIIPRFGQGFRVVNRVSLEDYTAGVLPSEMVSSWPMEALKTQAILARTYALSKLGRHGDEGFDVCDSQHCQVYRGLRAEEPKTNEAVRQTAGLVVKYGGQVMPVVFSAQCGGHTQDYLEAWGLPYPVVGVPDYDERYNKGLEFPLSPALLKDWIYESPPSWCRMYQLKGYKNYRWAWVVSAVDIQKKLPDLGRLRKLIVTRRSTAGWAVELHVVGEKGEKDLRGDSIRRYLGGIRSNLIWIEPQFNPQGWPEEFIIYGGGWGHGVGMCQVGCYGLAQAGKDCLEIIRHYFPKGHVEKLDSQGH